MKDSIQALQPKTFKHHFVFAAFKILFSTRTVSKMMEEKEKHTSNKPPTQEKKANNGNKKKDKGAFKG